MDHPFSINTLLSYLCVFVNTKDLLQKRNNYASQLTKYEAVFHTIGFYHN